MILWHGAGDELIFAQGSIDYYKRVVEAVGDLEATKRFARLFILPGVDHVGGLAGPGLVDSGLGAAIEWVEHNKAPDELQGVKTDSWSGDTVMTRPICAYPLVARYNGTGSTNDASSFTCSEHF